LAAPSIVEDEIFHPHIPVSDTQEITVDIEFKTLKFILRYIYTGVLDKELLLSTGMLKITTLTRDCSGGPNRVFLRKAVWAYDQPPNFQMSVAQRTYYHQCIFSLFIFLCFHVF